MKNEKMCKIVLLFYAILCSQSGYIDASNGVHIGVPEGSDEQWNQSRIYGGAETTIDKFPFVAQAICKRHLQITRDFELFPRHDFYMGILIRSYMVICGSAILTEQNILTAAHCVTEKFRVIHPRSLSVRVGSAKAEPAGYDTRVARIRTPRYWNMRSSFDFDIAVLLLTSQVPLGRLVQIAMLPPQGYELPPNSPVTIIGWGKMESGKVSFTLREVTIPTVDLAICAQRYSKTRYRLTTRMFCAGLLDVGGKDSCQGDSGGPVIYKGVVVGLVSWGVGCGTLEYPGVNTKVSSFSDWVTRMSRAVSVHSEIISLLAPLVILLIKR